MLDGKLLDAERCVAPRDSRDVDTDAEKLGHVDFQSPRSTCK